MTNLSLKICHERFSFSIRIVPIMSIGMAGRVSHSAHKLPKMCGAPCGPLFPSLPRTPAVSFLASPLSLPRTKSTNTIRSQHAPKSPHFHGGLISSCRFLSPYSSMLTGLTPPSSRFLCCILWYYTVPSRRAYSPVVPT